MDELPHTYYFSDVPVPPSKSVQLMHHYDQNKRTAIPAIKDAVLDSVFDPSSLSFKYSVTAAHDGNVLRPLSTCLPFGAPNRVTNLQDICSGILPFAVQAQQWLREVSKKSSAVRGKKGKGGKKGRKKGGDQEAGESEDEIAGEDDEESRSESSQNRKSQSAEDRDSDGEFETEERTDMDPLVHFGHIPSIPDSRNFKPYTRDRGTVQEHGKRATVQVGFRRLPPLNSPINWWYSGGTVAYTATTLTTGFLFHPTAALTRLAVSPVVLTDKRSYQRVVAAERQPVQPVQTKAPIYQVESQLMDGDPAALVFARLPDEIVVKRFDTSAVDSELTTLDIIPTSPNDSFTHTAPSQYMRGEFLTASHKGNIEFRTTGRRISLRDFDISHMAFKNSAKNGWTGCYFGAHPRDICVATPCAVEVFDGRIRGDNEKSQLRLLGKMHDVNSVANDIVASTLFLGRDSYHVMATTKEIVVVDSRFTKAPVLRYPCQATTAPAYLSTLTDSSPSTDVILAGSQMSQQVMCFEVALPPDSQIGAARMLSVPFLTATPRQLIPQAIDADLQLEFTMKQRLEKPIIGMTGIVQPNGDGFTVVVQSALGDLFLQSFETVAAESYEANGTACFSTVQPDIKLHKKERQHLSAWLIKSDREVIDPTMKDYLRPFTPSTKAGIREDMEEKLRTCSMALTRKAHKLCRRCDPDLQHEEGVDLPDETCDRCRTPLRASQSRVIRSTGPNRFCYVEENNTTTPILLPKGLQRDDQLKEMARTNRIVHKILTHCYGEDIPPVDLLPETRDLPPVSEKKKRARKSTIALPNLLEGLLQDGEPDEAAVSSSAVLSPPGAVRRVEFQSLPPEPLTRGAFHPLATSTQVDPAGETHPEPQDMPDRSAQKSAKKPRRLTGF